MKALLLVLICLVVPRSVNCQSDPDSLMARLYRAARVDSLFESFTMSNRRRVYTDPQGTYRLYRKVYELAIEKELPELAATALDVQGIYFQNTGLFDSAELRYREGLKLRQALHHKLLIAQSYNNLGVLQRRKGQYDSALYYYQQSLQIARVERDSALMGDYLSNIGLVYQNQHDYENAIRYNLKSLTIRQAINDTLKIAASYNNIGITYLNLKNYEEAGAYFEKSLKIKRNIGELGPIANTLMNLGTVHYYQADYTKAAAALEEALAIYQSQNNSQNSAATLENLAFVTMRAGDLPLAYEYSNRALAIRKSLDHPGDIISSYANTAKILIELGRKSDAASLLDSAYELARQFGETAPLRQVAQGKATLYEAMGDYRNAYQFHLEYSALKDSLLNESMLSRIAELREQYETAQKEQELQLQEAKLLQQEALIGQRSQQRNFMMALTTAILVIFLLVFFSYRGRLRARDALNRKTLEMEAMRSHFFANISHEFRTPLTLIHSMADELMEKDVQPTLVKTVKTNANRLLQLVDQLLDLSRVDAGQLGITARPGDVGRFIRAIAGSFASMQKEIRYEVKVEASIDGYFDADKLEKILVNLLSNAFKFTPGKERLNWRPGRSRASCL